MTSLEAAQEAANQKGGCGAAMAATSETRVFGATGKDAPSWEDTNMALFGSDIEKKIKEAAAGGEAEWQGVGEKKGVLVWRIEQFRVVPWPETKYGEFHVGDSYIALHTYQPSPANPSLAWDIHFWIGNESTQDEYGTAAYKTTELGDYLGHGKARHYREVQGRESRRFLKLFGMKLKYLQGGVESGFRHVDHSREAVLLRVKGRGARNVILTQVDCKRSLMNSGDVFLLDCTEGVFMWTGSEANAWEKRQAGEVAQEMRQREGGNREKMGTGSFTEVTMIEEGTPRDDPPAFAKYLPVETDQLGGRSRGVRAAEEEPDADVVGMKISLYQLQLDRARPNEIGILPLMSGKLPRDALQGTGVYVVDTGFQLMLWVGASASFQYRVTAFNFAQAYLKRYGRPAVLPLSRESAGSESVKFWSFFEPPAGYRIDVQKDPARYHPAMRPVAKRPKKTKPTLEPQATWVAAGEHKNPSAIARTKGGAAKRAAEMEAKFGAGGGKATVPVAVADADEPGAATEAPTAAAGEAAETGAAEMGASDKPAAGGKAASDTATEDGMDTEDEEEDEVPAPRWEEVKRADKCRCYNGVCYPVVSDAWGCCLTSIGCAKADLVNCLGMDIKGLYLMCGQIECLCCKPSFDEEHKNVCCVLGQGYLYGVVPECMCCPTERQKEIGQMAYCRVCKGSQQLFCVQNRCSLPCDDEVPSTCTCCGHQCCQHFRKTGDMTNRKKYNYELVPFLPYPEVRIMDEEAIKRGGEADDFDLHWLVKGCLRYTGYAINTKSFHVFNSCCGFQQSVGCDFPSCVGVSLLGSCLCCVELNIVMCKPVERHPRVECMFCQGGAYLAKPRPNKCLGCSVCKGTVSVCCLEHRYSYPVEEGLGNYPVLCTLCGAQCCQFGKVEEGEGGEGDGAMQCESNRKCCTPVAALPRVKPAVAEASDVLYHETRKALKTQLKANVGGGGDAQEMVPAIAPAMAPPGAPPQAQMQRL